MIFTLSPFFLLVNTYFDNFCVSFYSVFMSRVAGAARINPDPSRVRANARIGLLKAAPKRTAAQRAAGPFSDLTYSQRKAAEAWLWKFCVRWEGDLPPWRRGILIGVARRLALNPPPAGWGLSLGRCYGARVLADRCRVECRPHPRIAAMNRGLAWKRAGRPALPSGQTLFG